MDFSRPQIGVVESADLALTLTLLGFEVIGGGEFRDAALRIRQHPAQAPIPVIVADLNRPGLRAWAENQAAAGSHIVVLRPSPEAVAVSATTGASLAVPATVNQVLAHAGWAASPHALGDAIVDADFTVRGLDPYRASAEPELEPAAAVDERMPLTAEASPTVDAADGQTSAFTVESAAVTSDPQAHPPTTAADTSALLAAQAEPTQPTAPSAGVELPDWAREENVPGVEPVPVSDHASWGVLPPIVPGPEPAPNMPPPVDEPVFPAPLTASAAWDEDADGIDDPIDPAAAAELGWMPTPAPAYQPQADFGPVPAAAAAQPAEVLTVEAPAPAPLAPVFEAPQPVAMPNPAQQGAPTFVPEPTPATAAPVAPFSPAAPFTPEPLPTAVTVTPDLYAGSQAAPAEQLAPTFASEPTPATAAPAAPFSPEPVVPESSPAAPFTPEPNPVAPAPPVEPDPYTGSPAPATPVPATPAPVAVAADDADDLDFDAMVAMASHAPQPQRAPAAPVVDVPPAPDAFDLPAAWLTPSETVTEPQPPASAEPVFEWAPSEIPSPNAAHTAPAAPPVAPTPAPTPAAPTPGFPPVAPAEAGPVDAAAPAQHPAPPAPVYEPTPASQSQRFVVDEHHPAFAAAEYEHDPVGYLQTAPALDTVVPQSAIGLRGGAHVIFSFAGKGGVGKTSLALLLAQRAAQSGRRVAVVDMNRGQGDIRSYLRIDDPNLPTIYNSAHTGVAQDAVIDPNQLNNARHPSLSKLNFAVVMAPPHDLADPAVVTADVYARTIALLQEKTDLVVIDTQITEARDTSGLIDRIVVPALTQGAWGFGVTDMSKPGLENLLARTSDFVARGVPRERLLLSVNKAQSFDAADQAAIERTFGAYARFIGAIGDDLSFANSLNAGQVDADNPTVRPVIDATLLAVTGDEAFAARPTRRKFGRRR